MDYHYYNYQVYFEKARNYAIEDFRRALHAFNVVKSTSTLITLDFGGWKFWLELNLSQGIEDEALEIAMTYDKPMLEGCNARLETYAEDDREKLHYNDHLHVLKTLAALPGIHIFDPVSRKFLQETKTGLLAIDTSFLEHVAGDKALNEKVDAVRKFPKSAKSWYRLGVAYHGREQLKLAIACFKNAILLDNGDSYAYHYLGIVYKDLEEYEPARINLQKAISINPGNLDFLVTLGLLHARQNDKEMSLNYLHKAVARDPENLYANANLGYYLLFFGEAAKALPYIDQSRDTISYFNKGHYHLIQGNRQKAVLWYAKSLGLYTEETEFWKDFDDDFVLMRQYGITLRKYNRLKRKIIKALKHQPRKDNSKDHDSSYEVKVWGWLKDLWRKLFRRTNA